MGEWTGQGFWGVKLDKSLCTEFQNMVYLVYHDEPAILTELSKSYVNISL